MKYFNVYARTDCEYCKKAMKLLDKEELPFAAMILDKAEHLQNATKMQFNWMTVPIVIQIDGEQGLLIGGYTELERYIKHAKKDGSLEKFKKEAKKEYEQFKKHFKIKSTGNGDSPPEEERSTEESQQHSDATSGSSD